MENQVIHAQKNPIFPSQGICDPHVKIWNDMLYLYTGHDANPLAPDYEMDRWEIWRSLDGITFEQRQTILPTQTYMGNSKQCWALDVAARNGNYYIYFSNGNQDMGVLVSDAPDGIFVDALGKPLLETANTPTMAYDPHIFIDNDENQTPYLLFGGPRWAYGAQADGYYIARLKENMIELDEVPKKIEVNHRGDDKVAMHFFGGKYYLSWASHYAIGDSVYGPFHYKGNTGASKDHGTFFEWHHQWFHAFTIFDPTMIYRSIGLCYVHYGNNGQMVSDELTIQYGIGQYDASWHRIDAANYMKASRYMKRESCNGGFEVAEMTVGDYLIFPNVRHMPLDAQLYFFGRRETPAACTIEIREGGPQGYLLGIATPEYIERPLTYCMTTAPLCNKSTCVDLCFLIKGEAGASMTLDSFHIRTSQ